MRTTALLIIAIALQVTSCGDTKSDDTNGDTVTTPKVLKLTQKECEMLKVSNDFTFNLLRKVKESEDKENIVLSPLSASMMLGMLMNGADGATLSQLKTSLGFNENYSLEDINKYYGELISALPALDTSNKVKLANSIWAQKDFPFYDDFINTNKGWFSAQIDNVDFSDEKAADVINQWAANNTNNLIKEVITQKDLVNAVMVLANALYFKGVWEEKFEKTFTEPRDFTTSNGETIKTDMMYQSEEFMYADIDGGQLLEMDYKEGKYCMDIILPAEDQSLDKMIESLTAEQWNNWLGKLWKETVIVRLPKLETRYSIQLNNALTGIGIVDAFDEGKADFSKMSEKELFLSLVKQLCYLKVNEEGTEAAAVTVGVVSLKSSIEPDPKRFDVNRPYLMVIREKKYGTILFTAAIGNPKK